VKPDAGAPDVAPPPPDRAPDAAPPPPPDMALPPPPPDEAPPPPQGYQPCPSATQVGYFRIELTPDFTGVEGAVSDGVIPDRLPVEVRRSGECRLFTRVGYTCAPECAVGQTCAGPPRGCIPLPRDRNVGAVTVNGLKAPLVMTPTMPGNFYTNTDELPKPAFDPGTEIRLSAAGGEYTPFAMRVFGISALTISDAPILVESGKAVRVAWTPAGGTGGGRIQVVLNINHHGTGTNYVECDVADSAGAVDISAELITELVRRGFSGWPSVEITRRSVDSATIAPGCVQFSVVSQVSRPVNVAGLTSCREPEDCPAGQVCNIELACKPQ
jgi:hypothetical protein